MPRPPHPTDALDPAGPGAAEAARQLELAQARQGDARLVERIRAGDPEAWRELLSRYQQRLFGLCCRVLHDRQAAEDVCQDAMVKIVQGLAGYDGRAALMTWMTRITINCCLSRMRSEKLRRHASLDRAGLSDLGDGGEGSSWGAQMAQTREPSAASRVESSEAQRLISQALSLLDPEQRAILLLRDQRGLDYDQIGEVLGIAVGTVKSRLFRARAALREAVERLESPPKNPPTSS